MKNNILLLPIILAFIFLPLQEIKAQLAINSQIDSLNNRAEKILRSYPDSALVLIEKSSKMAISNSYKIGEGIALIHRANIIGATKGKYKEGVILFQKAISILEKTNNKADLGFAYTQRGFLQERLGNIEKAFNDYQKAVEVMTLYQNQGTEDAPKLHIVYNNLGSYYQRRGNYLKGLEYFNKALSVAEKQNNQEFVAACFANIGNIHYFQEDIDKAILYYKKTVEIKDKIGSTRDLANINNNIGGLLISQDKNKEALVYLKKASAIYKKTGNNIGYTTSLINIGAIQYNNEEYDEAIKSFKRCLEIEGVMKDKALLSSIYNNLAASHNEQQNYDSAIVYAQKGLEIAKSVDTKNTIIDNLNALVMAHEGKNNFKKAYNYHLEYTDYKDSVYNIEKTSEINALLLERKELENGQLEKDNFLKNNALQKERFERQNKEQAILILEKQAEADRLFVLAKESQNQRQADSLYRAAQNAQLETENLKIKAEKTKAEREAAEAKNEQKIAFQQNLSILFGIIVLAALTIAFIAYRNQKNKQKTNLLLAEKNEEINLQNELLEDANQTKDKLFAIVAHDLRSPMMAFQDVSRQLEFYIKKQDSEKLLRTVKLLDTSANNLTSLLNNLLHWSLLQQNRETRYQLDAYSLNLLLSEIIDTYKTISEPKKIEWQTHISDELSVFVDAPSFQTMIRNIVSNAVKFTPQEGKIRIEAQQKESIISLSIQDSGAGIPLEVQQNLSKNILNPTQKGTKNEKGTGLGLLLCYEFAKANDIEINVDSNKQLGTKFTLTIPTPNL